MRGSKKRRMLLTMSGLQGRQVMDAEGVHAFLGSGIGYRATREDGI
jgi:hypothetical protein